MADTGINQNTPFRAIIKTPKPGEPRTDGVTGTFQVMIRGYAKPGPNKRDYIQTLANEYIATRLADYLGLPISPHGLIQVERAMPPGPYFTTFNFACDGGRCPVIDVESCLENQLKKCSGSLIFDIFVGNGDRHGGNISYLEDDHYWLYDHGYSLLGVVPNYGITRLKDIEDRLGCSGPELVSVEYFPSGCFPYNRHVFLDCIGSDKFFGEWIHKIENLPDYQIDNLCFVPFDIGINKDERIAIADFLKKRKRKMWNLIQDNSHEFKNINQWGLPNIGGVTAKDV